MQKTNELDGVDDETGRKNIQLNFSLEKPQTIGITKTLGKIEVAKPPLC
jgi:hypothetical protein